jgi:hypothetical protein
MADHARELSPRCPAIVPGASMKIAFGALLYLGMRPCRARKSERWSQR